MAPNLLFVVGAGRSGTSLVQSMLAAHPHIAFLPETAFVRNYILRGKLQKLYRQKGKSLVVQTLDRDERFRRIGLEAEDLVAKSLLKDGCLDVNLYRRILFARQGSRREWVGDKDPRLIEFLPLLHCINPQVRIIHVFRDPRDVLLSKKKAAWSKNGHIWKHIFANRVQFAMGRRFGCKIFGKNYHEVCYEELISEPEKVLTGLCEAIGIRYHWRMLSDFGKVARELVSETEIEWKQETMGPLLKDNMQKWRTALKAKEIYLTELCCQEIINHADYTKDRLKQHGGFRDLLWILAGWLSISLAARPYIFLQRCRIRRVCRRID